jgi:ribonuclease P protein component
MPSPDGAAAGRRGKRRRLTRSGDFDRAFRQGRSYAGRHVVLHAFPRPAEEAAGDLEPLPRLGVSVGRKVGGAVERNRVKRVLREAFWSLAPVLPADHDFVLVARPDAAALAEREGEAGFESALRELVEQAGLAGPGEEASAGSGEERR